MSSVARLAHCPDCGCPAGEECNCPCHRRGLTPEQRAGVADYRVLVEYDVHRSGRYGDMSAARRDRELNRLGDALLADGVPIDRTGEFPASTPAELAEAFERVGRPRLRRLERETSPVDIDGVSYDRRTRYNGTSLEVWREVERRIAIAALEARGIAPIAGGSQESTPPPGTPPRRYMTPDEQRAGYERPDNLYRPSKAINEPPTAAWYIVAILAPFIGIILGIVAAARSQTGPALALWATSLVVGPVFWLVFWTVVAVGSTS